MDERVDVESLIANWVTVLGDYYRESVQADAWDEDVRVFGGSTCLKLKLLEGAIVDAEVAQGEAEFDFYMQKIPATVEEIEEFISEF